MPLGDQHPFQDLIVPPGTVSHKASGSKFEHVVPVGLYNVRNIREPGSEGPVKTQDTQDGLFWMPELRKFRAT